MPDRIVYKIAPRALWSDAEKAGRLVGSPVDLADGYIHFSTASQVEETLRRHYAGKDDLLLVAVDTAGLGDALKWEPSRGGDLFPHLHAPLPLSAVLWTRPLPMRPDGTHDLPPLEREA